MGILDLLDLVVLVEQLLILALASLEGQQLVGYSGCSLAVVSQVG